MENKLPSEKRRENLRALMTMKGMYIVARPKQITPRIILVMKPHMRCFLDNAGNQAVLFVFVDDEVLREYQDPLLPPSTSTLSRKGCSSSGLTAPPNGDFNEGNFNLPAKFVSELVEELFFR